MRQNHFINEKTKNQNKQNQTIEPTRFIHPFRFFEYFIDHQFIVQFRLRTKKKELKTKNDEKNLVFIEHL